MFGPTDPKASNLRASPQASPKLTNQRSKSVAAASTVMPAVGSPAKKGLVVPPTNHSQAKSPSPSRALNSQLSGSNSRDLSGCKVALDQLIEKKRAEYQVNARKNTNIEIGMTGKSCPPSGWRPKGYLVAHLHEHQGYISKLTRIPDKPLFASGSSDGCVRVSDFSFIPIMSTARGQVSKELYFNYSYLVVPLTLKYRIFPRPSFVQQVWDCAKFEGSLRRSDAHLPNHASLVHKNPNLSPVTTMSADPTGHNLATSAEDGSIRVIE